MLTRPILIALALLLLPVSGRAQEEKLQHWTQFASKFAEAVHANEFPTQQNLVKQYKDMVKFTWDAWEAQWCAASSQGEAAETVAGRLDRQLEALAFVNKIVHRSDYLVERKAWLQGLGQEAKQIKGAAWDRYNTIFEVWDNAMKLPTEQKMREVADLVLPLAESLEAAGDNYWAANCYHMMARCFEAIPEYYDAHFYAKKASVLGQDQLIAREFARQGADLRAQKLAKSGRIQEELVRVDVPLAESKAAYEEALKTGGDVVAEPGKVDDKGKTPDGKENAASGAIPGPRPNEHGKVDMDWQKADKVKLRPVSRPLNFTVPYFRYNAHWYFWPGIGLEDGGQSTLTWVPGGATIKNDSGKMIVDMDGDKDDRRPERVKFSAKPKMVTFKDASYRDGTKGDVYVRAMIQPSSYKIVGFGFRSTGKGRAVRAQGASSVTGKLRGEEFTIYDLNANGVFSDMGQDCIVLGRGRDARVLALSQIVMIEDKLYELSVSPNGLEVRTRPYDGPIAALKVEYEAKTMPDFLLAAGSGKDSSVYINLMDAVEKPMWVVPSAYHIHEGTIVKGRGEKARTIWIQKGRSGVFNVNPGQMNTWTLGGAGKNGFTFGFKTERRTEKGQEYIIIPGNEVKVYGDFGESYEYTMFGLPTPKVEIRKGKDGPVWCREEMRNPDNSDSEKSADLIWFPKTMEIKKTMTGDYSVRLEGDVPALGKASSSWTLGN